MLRAPRLLAAALVAAFAFAALVPCPSGSGARREPPPDQIHEAHDHAAHDAHRGHVDASLDESAAALGAPCPCGCGGDAAPAAPRTVMAHALIATPPEAPTRAPDAPPIPNEASIPPAPVRGTDPVPRIA